MTGVPKLLLKYIYSVKEAKACITLIPQAREIFRNLTN